MNALSSPSVTAVICAAGKGERAKMNGNKLFAPLYGGVSAADKTGTFAETAGRTARTHERAIRTDGKDGPAGEVLKGCVLEKTISAFDIPAVTEILVTASETDFEEISALCARFPRTRVVLGGKTRSDSVRSALKAATGKIVLVHDGARPFVSEKIISGCISSVSRFGSGICAVPAVDTVAVSENGYIGAVPPRDKVFALQTPQGFYTEELRRAYTAAEKEGGTYTDDSSVYAAFIGAPPLMRGRAGK